MAIPPLLREAGMSHVWAWRGPQRTRWS